ncbi:MAG: gluconokinase [Pseudolysinimonas sp.]|uniref:gluconokinase n=1 Tax=Pseudolysinimonas sp. TaxID=2680009 RepID=UPI003C70D47A
MSLRRVIVVMGVSGTGKSTIGRALAETLGLPFVEGDDLHPESNVAKMGAGIPLTDADRGPWLDLIAAELDRPVVITCSALKRAYRDRLRLAAPDLVLVYLHGAPELLASRMAQRDGHFMPTALLESQLATLEEPAGDENVIPVDVMLRPDEIVELVTDRLRQSE